MCVKERNPTWPVCGALSWPGVNGVAGHGEGHGAPTANQALCMGAQDTVTARGLGGVWGPCLRSSGSDLYWVTAGLALAEQWKVTTLSSSTGCGSTDRLTSGGSAERRDSLVDGGAVSTTWEE